MACPSPRSLLETLRRVLQAEFQIAPEAIAPEAHLVDDLELDSVDAVTLAACLEAEAGVTLGGDDIRGLSTVASVVELVSARLREQGDRADRTGPAGRAP